MKPHCCFTNIYHCSFCQCKPLKVTALSLNDLQKKYFRTFKLNLSSRALFRNARQQWYMVFPVLWSINSDPGEDGQLEKWPQTVRPSSSLPARLINTLINAGVDLSATDICGASRDGVRGKEEHLSLANWAKRKKRQLQFVKHIQPYLLVFILSEKHSRSTVNMHNMQLMPCLFICGVCGRFEDLERPAAMAPVTDRWVDGFQSASPQDELCARVSLGWTAAWLLFRLQRPCVTMALAIRPAPRHEFKFSRSLALRCEIESNLFLDRNYLTHESEKLARIPKQTPNGSLEYL